MKKRSLWFSAAGALVVAIVLAGCGTTTYFAGRELPPSGLPNRVLIAVQNPSASVRRRDSVFVDAFYDIRYSYNQKIPGFSIAGFSGALPINDPEHARGAGRCCLWLRRWFLYTRSTTPKKGRGGGQKGLNGPSSSIFITRNRTYIFAASQASACAHRAGPDQRRTAMR